MTPALKLLEADPVSTDIVAAIVSRNEHVLLPDDLSHKLLDDVAIRLSELRSRVFRPSTLDMLTLPGLMSQVVGHESHVAVTAADLERGFEMLTDVGAEFDRVVLVLDRADALEPAALRYIQFAVREFPLQLVFAGGPGIRTLLDNDEFGWLRRHFVEHAGPATAEVPHVAMELPIESPVATPPLDIARPSLDLDMPVMRPPEQRRAGFVRRRGWLLAGTGVAASITGLAWLLQSGALDPYLEAHNLTLGMLRPHSESAQP